MPRPPIWCVLQVSTNGRSEPSAARSVTRCEHAAGRLVVRHETVERRVAHEAHAAQRERHVRVAARHERRAAAQARNARGRAGRLRGRQRVGHAECSRGGCAPVGERRVVAAVRRGVVQRRRRGCQAGRERPGSEGLSPPARAGGPHAPARLQEGARDRRRTAAGIGEGRQRRPPRARARTSPWAGVPRPCAASRSVRARRAHRRARARGRRRARRRPGAPDRGRPARPAQARRQPECAPPGRAGERPAVDLRARARARHCRGSRSPAPAPPGERCPAPRPPRGARAEPGRRAARPSRRRGGRRAFQRSRSPRCARGRRRRCARGNAADGCAAAPPASRRRARPCRGRAPARAPRHGRRR